MKKPAWFELIEGDGPTPRSNVKRRIRTLLLSFPLLAIFAGVVLSQTIDQSTSGADEASSVIASASPSTPSIASPPPLPTGGDYEDDDDEDDDEKDDDEKDDDEEDDD